MSSKEMKDYMAILNKIKNLLPESKIVWWILRLKSLQCLGRFFQTANDRDAAFIGIRQSGERCRKKG
jgi:hypothetical protein